MQKDTFVLFAKYNKAVNEKMDQIITTLSPEEWNKPLGGYHKSVRGLCSHLYICDFNWLGRFSKLRDFTVFKDALFKHEPFSFSEVLFENKGDYLVQRPLLDEKIIAFTDELVDADINALLKVTDPRGNAYEQKFGGLVMHCLNHETYHKGMLSLYLEMLGRENDFCSLRLYL